MEVNSSAELWIVLGGMVFIILYFTYHQTEEWRCIMSQKFSSYFTKSPMQPVAKFHLLKLNTVVDLYGWKAKQYKSANTCLLACKHVIDYQAYVNICKNFNVESEMILDRSTYYSLVNVQTISYTTDGTTVIKLN